MNSESNKAKVVHIIDDYTVVINKGHLDGVDDSDRFLIYKIGPEIADPDTGASLGNLEVVRGRASVSHLQEHLTTLVSIETKRIEGQKKIIRRNGIGALSMHSLSGHEEIEEGPRTVRSTLEAEEGDLAKLI